MSDMVFLIPIYILIPLLILFLCEKFPILGRLSPIIWTYIIGITLGNIGILPGSSNKFLDMMSGITVIMALPLMLFSIDLSRWKELSGKAGLSMIYAFIAIFISSALGVFLFGSSIPESAKVAGLMVGVYTGGTPNLAALKTALQVETTTYLAVHTADVMVTGIYFLMLLSFGKNIFRKILPAYQKKKKETDNFELVSIKSLKRMFYYKLDTITSLLLTVLVVAAGFGISVIFSKGSSTVVLILSVTTIALLLSFVPVIRNLKTSFSIGELFILVFCTVVGSMADVRQLINTIPAIIGYVSFTVFLSIFIHTLLSRFSGIDADTMIITSTSAIYSPPFVPVVAVALGNKEVIFAGITTGLIGYAAGNYLGVIIAGFLEYVSG